MGIFWDVESHTTARLSVKSVMEEEGSWDEDDTKSNNPPLLSECNIGSDVVLSLVVISNKLLVLVSVFWLIEDRVGGADVGEAMLVKSNKSK